jgi:hypothetical protein
VFVFLVALAPTPASAARSLPAPTITSAVVTSATSIDVAWTPVDRATGYEVRWTAYWAETLTTTNTSAQLRVSPSTSYTIEVAALGRNTRSAWSEPVSVTTPPAPPSVGATAVRPDTVLLTWYIQDPSAVYEVYAVAPDGTLDGPLQVREDGAPNRVLVSTTAETTSSYVVVAIVGDERSAPSETVTVTTPPRWSSALEVLVFGPVEEGTVNLFARVETDPEDEYPTLGGEVTFTINGGEPVTVPVTGGGAGLETQLTAGTYEVAAAWSGDSAYLPSSASIVIQVRPALAPLMPPEHLTSKPVFSAAAGDVTGDRRPDLVTVEPGETENLLQLRAGQADGSLGDPITRGIPHLSDNVALGDLDGDGHSDAVITSRDGLLVSAGSSAGFGTPSLIRTNGLPIDVEVADVTGDGSLDVVVSTTTALQVLPGTGRLSTRKAQTIASGPVANIQVGNTTGDSRLEVAGVPFTYAGASEPATTGEPVVVWTPTGTGWTEAFRSPDMSVRDITLGDVTGDGLADLAWIEPVDEEYQVHLRTGPTFSPIAVPRTEDASGIATGDLDGDGRDDLVASPFDGSGASVWRVTENEVSFPARIDLDQSSFASDVLVTDLSGDDLDDLLVVSESDGLVIVRRA